MTLQVSVGDENRGQRSQRQRHGQRVAERLVRRQGKPGTHGENDEHHGGERNRDGAGNDAAHGPAALATQHLGGELAAHRERDQ